MKWPSWVVAENPRKMLGSECEWVVGAVAAASCSQLTKWQWLAPRQHCSCCPPRCCPLRPCWRYCCQSPWIRPHSARPGWRRAPGPQSATVSAPAACSASPPASHAAAGDVCDFSIRRSTADDSRKWICCLRKTGGKKGENRG